MLKDDDDGELRRVDDDDVVRGTVLSATSRSILSRLKLAKFVPNSCVEPDRVTLWISGPSN